MDVPLATGDTTRPVHGYPRLASLMAMQPGLAIFRRFATLNAKNLLYLQAELVQLEWDLHQLEHRDSRSKEPREQTFARIVRRLMAADGGERGEQWSKVVEIRAKLKDYNELLLTQAELYKLQPPNPHDFKELRDWLDDDNYGKGFLEAPEHMPWKDELTFDTDLVALSARKSSDDAFTRWFTGRLVPWLHRKVLWRFKKRNDNEADGEEATYTYNDNKLDRICANITLVVGSTLPAATNFALYYVSDIAVKLGLILVFSVVFATVLTIFTSARRVEIFTFTVALASVQVVFVGTSSQPSHVGSTG